jgi:CheY-like chemotaxis protein
MTMSPSAASCRAVPTIRAVLPAGEDRPPPRQPPSPKADLSRSRWRPRQRPEPDSPLPSLEGRTILVIDDDPDALELLHLILESCGATVLTASTTMHARGYLLTVTPDLIVCDLSLPREDGLAFIRGVPAVAVTAFYEDYPPTLAHEFSAYFQKPVDIDALTRAIASLLPPRQT